jgi:hypothetical protein
MLSRKKPLSSSPISWTFATALFFLVLTLTIAPSSFMIVFADDAQRTALSGYNFITTNADIFSYIPIPTEDPSTEEETEETEEEDPSTEEETEETEEDGELPLRVAFVKPSFTYAAYQLNGFYNFYEKYRDLPDGTTNVTTDLHMLTVRVPDETYIYYKDDPREGPTIPLQQNYFDMLMGLVEEEASSQNLDIDIEDITDEEVHEGDIFDSDGNNAYDVLFLFHQEYVTQAEYDNLRKFVVQNGGTIVFNHANIFTVEVNYDSATNTVTLVRGHMWAYDGSSAWRAERERWINENQQWVGSNFMEDPANDDVIFLNNPFNYEHSEEQIVTNPNAMIIFDFGVMEHTPYEIGDEINRQHFPYTQKVAIYEMSSGKGKVINLGIFSHKLEDNQAFLDFYKEEILSRALG